MNYKLIGERLAECVNKDWSKWHSGLLAFYLAEEGMNIPKIRLEKAMQGDERAIDMIPVCVWCKLTEWFEVDLDYLLGRQNERKIMRDEDMISGLVAKTFDLCAMMDEFKEELKKCL